MRKGYFRSILCLCLLSAQPAWAWWGAGHMIVANIAYQHLEPAVRNEVVNLLRQMDVESTFKASYKFDNAHPNYTMMAVSTWPDDISSYPNFYRTTRTWHYIEHAYTEDNTPLPNAIPRDNVVFAIKSLSTNIKQRRGNLNQRARSLSYLIHFVGDIHQPMHCAEYYSAGLPAGDRGGNRYDIHYIEADGRPIKNLHALWDSGLALYPSKGYRYDVSAPKEINALSRLIMRDFPKNYFSNAAKVVDPAQWEAEGHALARVAHQTAKGAGPSDEYINKHSINAEKRLALAGYRLANLLNKLLGAHV